MKLAIGIIAIACSFMAFLQSCTVTGLSELAGEQSIQAAGAFGALTAFLMFLGGAFTFGLPGVARVLFFLSALASVPAREEFPDSVLWGGLSLVLCVLLIVFVRKPKEGAS